MWTGRVSEPSEGDPQRKGSPPLRRLRIEADQDAGRTLNVRHGPTGKAEAVQATIVTEIRYRAFERCPICLVPGPDRREHVPQGALGGHVRTLTCAQCNNMLGARIEGELTNWCFDALPNARAEGPGADGLRRIPRIYLRRTDDGKFVLFLDRPTDPAIRDMLANRQISLHMKPPHRNRYRLAALKHAYLAACCNLRYIPDHPVATTIRSDLLGARNAPTNADVPHSSLAADLGLMRSYNGLSGPPLALAAVPSRSNPSAIEIWISLAGNILVQWPLPSSTPNLT